MITICDFQVGFCYDTSCNIQSLADVVPNIRSLDIGDGEVSCLGNWKSAGWLRGLVWEKQILKDVQERKWGKK